MNALSRDDERRPDPDALLRRVQADERKKTRGRLTVFFGAAPGVGKTYAMLTEAEHQRDVERRDVVAGVVETHGRFETTTLVSSFERLPKRRIDYRGTVLEELDLDAALARKPALILVDELAHTNAEGSRHPKRWQDVDELLDAGIEVYTTLNVQHIESLNDVVAKITGIVVRETIPDSVLDMADEVKLVDLPPDDLIERLREGKVYVPAQAQRAIENFFRKGNLIALRELALRKTAERVDAEMQAWRRAHGIEETWAASDRLLVCISPSPFSANLLRVGKRMAASLRAQWFAVNVETPSTLRLAAADRTRMSENLRLAEQLGAEVVTLTGGRAADQILRFAREQNVTKIVAGKPRVRSLRDRVGRGFVDELIRGSRNMDIYVTVGDDTELERRAASRATEAAQSNRDWGNPGEYAVALFTVMAATGLGALLFGRADLADIVMIYLLGVVLIAMRFAFRVALTCAVLSVLAFDFFFIPPYLTFTVSDLRHVVTFGVMLLVAVVVASLAQRVKRQAEVARRGERRTAVLYALSRELSEAQTRQDVLRAACGHIEDVFEARAAAFARSPSGDLEIVHATENFEPPPKEIGIVQWVWSNEREAGAGTSTVPGGSGLYLPLVAPSAGGDIGGVLGIFPEEPGRFADPEQRRLADALATQTAMAVERARLAEETQHARIQVETEQLRSTLLSSVSHDLRTPLAVMKGATSTLLDEHGQLTPVAEKELLQAISEETERLDRLVRNLLDMTRLESGAVRVHKEWSSLEEVIGGALNRTEARLGERTVTATVPGDLVAPFDPVLIEQVLVNLLENAAKYTPAGTPIDVIASRTDGEVTVEIADRGPGVPAEQRSRIFEKFQRGDAPQPKGGVGLGLTICRAILIAHGGRIWVEERGGGGASFRFALPLEGSPPSSGALPEIEER